MHAEEETTPLVGAGPAPGEENQPAVVVPPRPSNNRNQVSETAADASTEIGISAARAAAAEAEKKVLAAEQAAAAWLTPTLSPGLDPHPICVGQLLNAQELQMLAEERKSKMPGYLECLSLDRQLVEDCLHLYNSKNPGNEYEPAPGVVTRRFHIDNAICWAHGNFVARRKSSGCFSFLPAPRTLFFFELTYRDGFDGVVTCTPLDEPVTEAYSILGFPLWWSTRRSGKFDSICKTCYRRYELPHPGIQKKFACGHDNVGKLCGMCYLVSDVLHPYPGEFAFGP
ncbi:unnamed protein product [Urochloa humidicola]